MILCFYQMPKWQSQVIIYRNLKTVSSNNAFILEVLSTLSACGKQTRTRTYFKSSPVLLELTPSEIRFWLSCAIFISTESALNGDFMIPLWNVHTVVSICLMWDFVEVSFFNIVTVLNQNIRHPVGSLLIVHLNTLYYIMFIPIVIFFN